MHVFLIAAVSVDGFIACETTQISTSWTSKEDKKYFAERTKRAGVVVMGATTYNTIGRPLPGRLNIIYTRGEFPIPPELKEQLRVTRLPPRELITQLEKEGFKEVAICGGSSIYTMFLKAGAVDTLYLTYEPVVFGHGVKLFNDNVESRLQFKNLTKLSEETLLIEYAVTK